MKKYGRIIGIDVGTKRVGLARTDLLRTFANPAGTFSPQDVFEVIGNYFEDQPVLAFVVGWPEPAVTKESASTRMVESFIKKLQKKYPDVPVVKVDERYSSRQAVETLIEAGIPQKKRSKKGRVDQTAAALLLQHFLETNNDFT